MSNTNLLGSEEWAVVGMIDPDANSAGTLYTDNIDMSLFEQIMAVVQIGNSTVATIDFGFASAATTNPTTLITGKSITQLVNSPSGTHDDKAYIVNGHGARAIPDERHVTTFAGQALRR